MVIKDKKTTLPVLKWAGGKRQIINQLTENLPVHFNTYFEPFIGAGALFLEVQPSKAIINDINFEISNLYKVLKDKDKTEKLKLELTNYQHLHNNLSNLDKKSDFYYSVRDLDKDNKFFEQDDFKVLARTIYLNKSCFNGIFRLNSKGLFNVPFGKKDQVKLFDNENIININNYLMKNEIIVLNGDFEIALKEVKKGDFVYFDPPYDSIEKKISFTTYSKDGFGIADQERLAKLFKKLNDRGAYLMLSNHNTKLIRELYKGFNIKVIHARRSINSIGTARGKVEEVIITNYE
jgi:DNA adenine methylase